MARLMVRPSSRCLLGAAHGVALLARLTAWPSWRGSWHSPLGVAHGAALLARPVGAALMARQLGRGHPGEALLMARPSWRAHLAGHLAHLVSSPAVAAGGHGVAASCCWRVGGHPPARALRAPELYPHSLRATLDCRSPAPMSSCGSRPPSSHWALIGRRACVGSSNKSR